MAADKEEAPQGVEGGGQPLCENPTWGPPRFPPSGPKPLPLSLSARQHSQAPAGLARRTPGELERGAPYGVLCSEVSSRDLTGGPPSLAWGRKRREEGGGDRAGDRGGGCGAGRGWVAPVLGPLQSWPLPGFKSCSSDHNRGIWGGGAGECGQTGTYTTGVCSEKYSEIVMQI